MGMGCAQAKAWEASNLASQAHQGLLTSSPAACGSLLPCAKLLTVRLASLSPPGVVLKASTTVFGSSRTLTAVEVSPPESVAVSRSSIQQGYWWSGAENDPLVTPLNSWTAWVWQSLGV